MNDRTNIAAALDKFDHCTGGWVCPAVAHFHGCHCDDGNCDRPAEHTAVPLRADPDTSDELFTEARRLLDAATPGPWERPSPTANWFTVPQPIQIDEADWGQETQENGAMCGYRIGTLADERAWRYADAELIAAAPRLIAALLERAVTAEAEARQLREAIGDPDELRWHRWHCEETGQGDDLRELLVRIADAADAADVAVAEGAEDREDTE